jgi:hypothetical protein
VNPQKTPKPGRPREAQGSILDPLKRLFFFQPKNRAKTRGLKKKKNKEQKNNLPKKQPTDFPFFFFFFLGAPCVGCGPSVDMPPHVGTRNWLRGLPLRASSL